MQPSVYSLTSDVTLSFVHSLKRMLFLEGTKLWKISIVFLTNFSSPHLFIETINVGTFFNRGSNPQNSSFSRKL